MHQTPKIKFLRSEGQNTAIAYYISIYAYWYGIADLLQCMWCSHAYLRLFLYDIYAECKSILGIYTCTFIATCFGQTTFFITVTKFTFIVIMISHCVWLCHCKYPYTVCNIHHAITSCTCLVAQNMDFRFSQVLYLQSISADFSCQFTSSLWSSKVHKEIHKQFSKQSLWMVTRARATNQMLSLQTGLWISLWTPEL